MTIPNKAELRSRIPPSFVSNLSNKRTLSHIWLFRKIRRFMKEDLTAI